MNPEPHAATILPMNKRLLLLTLVLPLAACGGGDDAPSEVSCDSFYWDGTVGTCLPDGWTVVDRDALDERGVPAETIVAFQAEAPVSGQFATVTVTQEPLAEPISSTDYSDASVQSVETLPGYELLDEVDVTIDGEDVILHVFAAQPRDEEPQNRFYQVSMSKENRGYTFTAATPLAVEESLEAQVLLLLENATLVEPEEEE